MENMLDKSLLEKCTKYTFLSLILIFSACDKVDELTKFDMDYTTEVVVPSSTGVNLPINLMSPEIESNTSSTFEVNDTRKNLVEEINLTDLELTITSPSDGNFNFLKSIEVFIVAEGLSEERIAWKEDISSSDRQELILETTDANIKEYILKDEFQLRVKTVTDEVITSDHHIEVFANFFVNATLI